MAMRPIRLLGDPVLRTVAEPVTHFDVELRHLVSDLLETLQSGQGRSGLAAPQIGVSARVFAYEVCGVRGHVVNPTIELSTLTYADGEACLSLPGAYHVTPRPMHAVVRGFDQHGDPVEIRGSGRLARALAHENEHLDGVLFIDRLDDPPLDATALDGVALGSRQSHHLDARMRVVQEVVMRDVPAVGTGTREDEYVADA